MFIVKWITARLFQTSWLSTCGALKCYYLIFSFVFFVENWASWLDWREELNKSQSNFNRTQSNINRTQTNINRTPVEYQSNAIEFYPEFHIRLIFDCVRQSNRNHSIAFDCIRLIRLEFLFNSVRLTSSGHYSKLAIAV